MPLCERCRSFTVFNHSFSFAHHPNAASLKLSAESCESCKFLRNRLNSKDHTRLFLDFCAEGPNEAQDSSIRLFREFDTDEFDSNRIYARIGPDAKYEVGVDIAAREGDTSSVVVYTRERLPDLDCPELYNLMSAWLNCCQSEHIVCQQEALLNPIKPPARLVDVGSFDGSREPFLVELEGKGIKYLTLSYCWGTSKQLVTTMANIEDYRKSIPFSGLSKTIQEAISITRKLGFQYLWVDALCIIQDSPNMDDWAEQSTRMAEIYGNSYATILAAIHPDSSVGVFPGRVPLESITVPFRPSVSDAKPWGSVQLVERPSDWNALSGRAWAFQEKEFAFRTFEFRSEGVSFRCRYGISREWERPTPTESHSLLFHSHKDTTSLVPSLGSPKDFPGVFIKWYGDLPAYTSLGLSYEEDRLPAISGLVKEYQSFIGGRYLAGLWEKDFIYGLQWRVRRSEDRPLRGNRRYERAPSWSWVSVQWQCYYCWPFLKRENSVNENAEEISRFLEITIEPATKDPNGRVKGGKLVIEAPLRRARWFKKHGWRIPMNKNDEHNEWDGTALFAAEEDGDDHNARAESSKPDHYSSAIAICLFDDDDERPELVECLLLTKRQGVLLALLDKTANTYRRIGFFRINGKESGLQKWLGRTETVTIV